ASVMAMGSLSVCFILKLLFFLLQITPSLAYSLKNCTLDYQETPYDDIYLNCASRKLMTVPDDIPKDAVSVKLPNNQIKNINKEDFCGMSKLTYLDLSENLISYVDIGSFIDLILLKTLKMGQNNLTSLTGNMFQGLSNLTMLDLNENNIQFIHASAFQFLTSLQMLDLGYNMLQKVFDIQPILQLTQIQRLDLRYNQFPSFETKDLMLNISSLKELSISGNNLERFSITTPAFPYLKKLEFSTLGRHFSLKWDIPDETLLRNITHLYIDHPVFSFKEFQNILQSLDSLRHLRLNYLNKVLKKGLLSTLIELNLTETHINALPKGSLQLMKNLNSLNVKSNSLTKVPNDIKNLTFLEILTMDYNLISELTCEDFVNTTRLTELSLNTNRITKLDKCVFGNLTNLKRLDLSNNLLLKFGDTFQTALQKLEVLNLNYNSVIILEKGDFQNLKSLKTLNVASNSVGRVKSKTFQGLNSLKDLTVSLPLDYEPYFRGLHLLENLIIYLNTDGTLKLTQPSGYEAYTNIKSLKSFTVICSGYHYGLPLDVPNQLLQYMKHLELFKAVNVYIHAPVVDTFKYNSQLKTLTLANTDLSELNPELFLSIPNLQSLDLSESNIKSLDFLLQANLNALRYLKLTDNEINVINETVFQFLPSLTYLDLSNNQFSCECSNAGFVQWIKNNKQTQVVNAHQYECSFPLDRRGTFLLDFDVQSCWNDGSFFYFISSTCLVVLTLLTSFIYHFLRWQLAYTFHLFLAFVYDSRRRKKGDPHQFDAFVSYNVHDEDWVYREMLPVLEGEQGWRLCLHHRDFQPGKPIMENITDAIYGSRKTICVISRHYLQSEWCSREIQMASFRLFDEQKDVLILLFLEDIPSRHLSPYYRMRKLVKKRTYLSWPQAAQHPGVFWQNVQRALQTGDALTEETDLLTGPAGP
uniref:TIR domain-containing protein n=1 Tax=Kryptolebias marmoratus TaxID=37003 RepID=A0A3Q3H263_KRYMA